MRVEGPFKTLKTHELVTLAKYFIANQQCFSAICLNTCKTNKIDNNDLQ